MIRTWFPVIILLLWALSAVAGAVLTLHPDDIRLANILTPPNAQAWLGYDDLGRPIFDRFVLGATTSFIVAITVVTVCAILGTFIGAFSAYYGGWIDLVMVRIIDVFLAFPGILLAIALASVMGPGIQNVVIALSVVGWVGYARLARAQVLSLKQREHVRAAVALGVTPFGVIWKHLLPLTLAPLIVEVTFGIAGVVISEAGLSFLGLGVQPPDASWGSMIRDGSRYMLISPHMVLAPGLSLVLVVLSVNLLGDRVRDHFDVKRRPVET